MSFSFNHAQFIKPPVFLPNIEKLYVALIICLALSGVSVAMVFAPNEMVALERKY